MLQQVIAVVVQARLLSAVARAPLCCSLSVEGRKQNALPYVHEIVSHATAVYKKGSGPDHNDSGMTMYSSSQRPSFAYMS